MKTEFSFNQARNRLWIETDDIGMVFTEGKEKKLTRVAIKLESKDLLRLYKMLGKIGFPIIRKEELK